MKITKVLMFLIIGILSLNLIYAGSIQKSFLIKGELTIPSIQGAGNNHPCDMGSGGDCKIVIIGPNGNEITVATNLRLTSQDIKTKLNNGITTPVLDITSTAPTVDFKVKIMKGHSSNYTTEVLSTVVSVPNPNADMKINSDSLVSLSTNMCPNDDRGLYNLNGNLTFCTEGGPVSIGGGGVNLNTLFVDEGTSLNVTPVLMRYYDSTTLSWKMKWKRIDTRAIAPQGAIPMDDLNISNRMDAPDGGILTWDVAANQMKWVSNGVNLLNDDFYSDITNRINSEIILSENRMQSVINDAIENATISYNNFDSELQGRVGVVEVIGNDELSGITQITDKYYKIFDGSNMYYLPVYRSTVYQHWAGRDFCTSAAFDSTYERITGTGYLNSGLGDLFTKSVGTKFSDYYTNLSNWEPYDSTVTDFYCRRYWNWINKGRYIPIRYKITGAGAKEKFKITIERCNSNTSSENTGNDPSWNTCDSVAAGDIKGATKSNNLGNDFTVTTTASGGYEGTVHVKAGSKTAIRFKFTRLSDNLVKYYGAAEIRDYVNPISEVTWETSPLACYKTVSTISSIDPTECGLTFKVPNIKMAVTGGSRYFTAKVCVGTKFAFGPESQVVCHSVNREDKSNFEFKNLVYYTPLTPNCKTHSEYQSAKIFVYITDNKTGQRFAKTFEIVGCTLQPN